MRDESDDDDIKSILERGENVASDDEDEDGEEEAAEIPAEAELPEDGKKKLLKIFYWRHKFALIPSYHPIPPNRKYVEKFCYQVLLMKRPFRTHEDFLTTPEKSYHAECIRHGYMAATDIDNIGTLRKKFNYLYFVD